MGAVRIASQTAVRIMCGLDVEVTRGVLLMNRSHRNYRVRRGVGGEGEINLFHPCIDSSGWNPAGSDPDGMRND